MFTGQTEQLKHVEPRAGSDVSLHGTNVGDVEENDRERVRKTMFDPLVNSW